MPDMSRTASFGLDVVNGVRYTTLSDLLDAVRAGHHDRINIAALESLGLDLVEIVDLVLGLKMRDVEVRVEGVKVTDEARWFMASCARVEAASASRRARQSVATKRARGQHVGRPQGTGGRPSKATPQVVTEVIRLISEGNTIRDVAEMLKLSAPTIYQILRRAKGTDPFEVTYECDVSGNGEYTTHIERVLAKGAEAAIAEAKARLSERFPSGRRVRNFEAKVSYAGGRWGLAGVGKSR